MAYIIEARDGVVNVDAGAKGLTLSESLLPKLASGSSYVVVLYNVTTGETATFQEGPFIGSKELAINSSTLDPGSWKLGLIAVLPSDLNNAQAYWDDARFPNLTPPEGISITKRLISTEIAALGINPSDFSFNLINTKADSKQPSVQVSSIQLSDKVLNVDAGEKLLKLDFSVTDDKSKLDFIDITFRNDAAQAEKELSYYPQAWNGWDRANFSILSDFSWAAPGTWYPVDIYAQDTSGNEISYNKDGFDDQYEASTLLSAGININSITFSVINKNADTTKPVVTFSSPQLVDNIINVDQGENTLVINVAVVDTGSGFQDLNIQWRNVVTSAGFNIWKDSVSIGSTGKFTIQEDTSWLSAGDWVVDNLSISDKAENTLEYFIDDFQSNTKKQKLLSAGIDVDKLAFKVINSNLINGNPDSSAPLLKISASETSDGILDAAIGEKALTLQGMVSDDKSGFSNLNIQFVNQNTITTRSFSISPSDLDDQGGFRKSIDFSWAANGTWIIQNFYLQDNAGNALNYYRSANPGSLSEKSKLLAAGIDVDKYTFEVRNSVQDITPPRVSLASPQLSDKVIDVNAGEKLATFTGKIQEQGSGFDYLNLSFQNQTDKTIRSLSVRGDSLQSDGSFTTTIDFSWASQGQWRLSSLWGSDKAGNRLQYYTSNDSTSWSLTSEVAYKKALLNAGLDIDALAFNLINSNSTPAHTYSLTPSASSINEGGTLTTSISTTGVTSGTTLYYALSGTGITTADFYSGALTGQVTVGTNGSASFSHILANDLTTEGAETLQIKLFSDSARTTQVGSAASVMIADTSITPALTYSLATVVRGNSLYTIVDGPSWTQAEANSVKLGGHLSTISGISENTFLNETFRNNLAVPDNNWNNSLRSGAWIGLTDPNIDGQWSWISGESYGYNNSAPGQNGVNGVVDGKVLLMLDPSGEAQRKGGLGTWWDSPVNAPSLYNNWLYTKGIAESPFIRRGDSAYVVVQGPTWEEAEANAVKLGGHLVTINDSQENQYLYEYVLTQKPDNMMFIGINDADNDGKYGWSSGEVSSFLNWASGEPSGRSYAGTENYGFVLAARSDDPQKNKWFDTTLNGNGGKIPYGIAEIKLAPNNYPTGAPTLSGTTKVGQLITIDRTPIQDADNFNGYTPTYNYSFEVSNDNGTTWTKLTTTDATDNNTTYTLTTAEIGKQVRGVVSFLDGYGTNEVVPTAGSSVTSAAVVRGNSLYTIVDGPSWIQAEANSVKLGGHLATINDDSELDWFKAEYSKGTYIQSGSPSASLGIAHLWIGVNDSITEKNYKWISGQNSTINLETSWRQVGFNGNETDAIHQSYDYGVWIASHNKEYGFGDTEINGIDILPNDMGWFPDGGNIRGISETPFIRRGDSAYVIVQGPTWEEAEANAVKLGGHLVTINDAEENQWISDTFRDRLAAPDKNWNNGLRSVAYIGLNDRESDRSPIWADGTPSGYSNFLRDIHIKGTTGRQDGWTAIFLDPSGLAQQYGGLNSWLEDGITNVDRTGTYKGIAEIKLAPNNDPTGTPTLSGSTKVGHVVNIDRTRLQDADNFTGYTPDFKYSWEVAKDPGMTMMIPVWESLNTADATDGNENFTITADLTGKLIRGVVSYLDGYGTQESVASTASAPITSSAPPVQSLTLTSPSKSSIRSGVSTTSAIAYSVSTGDTALTGIGASLYFDSTQLTVNTAGDPFKTGLLGNAITADTTNADGDPKTDKILALTYADFGGNFPGTGTTLPLTLANLNLVPTTTYSGTTLHLQGTPAVGFTATGADLTLGFNAAPTVTGTLTNKTINRGRAFTYTVPSGLFTDPDSTLSISAKTATGAALPSWLTFNATTGTFTGTPTSGGTFNLSVAAADELGSVSAPLTLNVQEVQSVSSSATDIRYQRNKDVTVPINYSTTDGSQTTGMSFKVHFNSSLFSFDPVTGVSNKATADLFQIGAVQSDTSNTDGDATTDKFIPINVASFSGSFPSGASPIKLADLIFKAADKAIDPLTGLKDTKINFSETEAAQGYGFQGTGASLKPMSFSLDVDGDGKVTALGDGLMVIRHLFGSAFSGSALTDKAISPTSPFLGGATYNTMTAEQKTQVASLVATNIQQGIDAGLLDVDKDGRTTALGDGLMVIRNLFGSAFSGTALIDKAISPSSPYLGGLTYATMTAEQKLAASGLVTANIDALKPSIGPGAPIISSVGGSDATVSSQVGDNVVVGSAVAGTTVTIWSGSTSLGTAVAGSDGAFSYALTSDNLQVLGGGTGRTVTAMAADTAGNVSAASGPKTFEVKTVAPKMSDTSLLSFPALAMINNQADKTYYHLYSGSGHPSSISQQYKGINSSLKFNGSSYTGSYKDTYTYDAQTYATNVAVTGEYTPSFFSALERSSPDGLSNEAYGNNNYITSDESTYTSLLIQSSHLSTVTCFGFSNLIDSNGNLKPLSSPVNFIRGRSSDESGTFSGSWDAIHQLTLGTSSPTSPWFSSNLWLIQGTATSDDSFANTNGIDDFSYLSTNHGLAIADNIESQGPSFTMYSNTDTSIFDALDARASGAIAATPKSLFYLGTNQPDELNGTSANEAFVPLGSADSITMGGGKDLLVLASTSGNPMVTDFSLADDKILLSNKIYPNLSQSAGALDENNFAVGNPKDSNDFILYNQVSGGLFYDADGNGTGTAIQIATLGSTIHPALTASSFIIG